MLRFIVLTMLCLCAWPSLAATPTPTPTTQAALAAHIAALQAIIYGGRQCASGQEHRRAEGDARGPDGDLEYAVAGAQQPACGG